MQNCFNSATLEGFQAWNDCLRSCHSISIRFEPGLWLDHSKTFFYKKKKKKKNVFLSHSEGDILVCFGSLSCCITQVPLSSQTDGRTISFRIFWKSAEFMVPSIMASCPGPEGLSHYHHHVWLFVWCSFYEMLCWFYTWFNGTQTFQKVQLWSHQSTEYLPTSLGYNEDFLFWLIKPNVFGICVLFGQQWLLP